MTEMKHTPSPWRIQPTNMADKFIVSGGNLHHDGFSVQLSEANARLIAAAPDLLAALQLAIRSRWLSIDVESNRTREACDIRRAICAAIDKATGAR